MDFRLLNQETLPQAASLWDFCFEKKGTPFYEWYFSQYCLKQNRILGGFDQDKLVTMLHLNPYELLVRDRAWKVPYIVGVATEPAFRGNHVMGQLMDTAFTMLRALKVPFVILMPIYAGIYQPYGFQYTHLLKEYKLPLAGLEPARTLLPSFTAERVDTLGAEPLLAPVYAKTMESYHGYVLRSSQNWQNFLITAAQENVETVVVRENGTPRGYALYSREGTTVKVLEALAIDPPAKLRLLQYFKGLAGTYQELEYLAPGDDLTYLTLPDQSLAPKLAPFMMGRVIDAAAILKKLSVPKELEGREFILGLKDEQIALNTLLVKVQLTPQGVQLLNTVEEPNVLMDVGTFTQLFFGTYSVQTLLQAGMLFAADASAEDTLAKLFPQQNNFINEYF